MTATQRAKPWDARLAARLVTPLCDSRITPNHFTTLRLLSGLSGCLLFALSEQINLAASLIVFSNFIDHADGELARIGGKSSRFGHFYDLAADAAVTIALFVGIGWGLYDAASSPEAITLGAAAGLSIALIFHLRNVMEQTSGKTAIEQPAFAGFEAEDILYLLPLVTIFDVLPEFLLAAGFGAPAAALLVGVQFLLWRRAQTQ